MGVRGVAALPLVLVAALVAAVSAHAVPPSPAPDDPRWTATWGAPLVTPGNAGVLMPLWKEIGGRTVRQVVRPTAGGSAVRLTLSNRYGTRPLVLTDVRVGVRTEADGIVAGSARRVRAGGRARITVPVGTEVTSDPVPLTTRSGQELAVDLYSPGPTGRASVGGSLLHTSYVSARGDRVGATDLGPEVRAVRVLYFLTAVDVLAPRAAPGAVVALGDSITAGAGTLPDTHGGWPDLLARRLVPRGFGVVNAGISGNALRKDSSCFGESALHRLTRDALGRAGVGSVILAVGLNDLLQPQEGHGGVLYPCGVHTQPSVAQLKAAYVQAARRIRACGVRVLAATLTPAGTSELVTPETEAKRNAVNRWLRTTGELDGVIDFARILGVPGEPAAMVPRWLSVDRLHPNPAGYTAMAAGIPLGLFGRAPGHGCRPPA